MTLPTNVHQLRTVKPSVAESTVAKVIAVSSGKGGVGKSSVALNLAIELSQKKFKVCIFDADTNLANINIMMGLTPRYTLQDYLVDNRSLQEVMLKAPGGVSIIPAASGFMDFVRYDPFQQKALIKLIQQLEQQFDYILVDTAAGISETVLSFIKAAAETIITITTEPTSLTDAFSLLKVLKKQGFNKPVQVLVNRASSYESAKEVLSRFSAALKKYLGLTISAAGYVLEDKNVTRSIMQQSPFLLKYPNTPASLCIRTFASKIIRKNTNQSTQLSDYLTEQKQLIDKNSPDERVKTHAPWMTEILDSIQSAPLDEAEQIMALISKRWINRLDAAQDNEKYLNSAGYKAAIKFASKLKI